MTKLRIDSKITGISKKNGSVSEYSVNLYDCFGDCVELTNEETSVFVSILEKLGLLDEDAILEEMREEAEFEYKSKEN